MENTYGGIQIPTITEEDLESFHFKHFPGTPLPQQFFRAGQHQDDHYDEDRYDEDDDGLGYYADGVKRTLTDSQISIFRHSELQRILWREAGEYTGPIFPKKAKQDGFKTHVKNKDRLREKKALLKEARAEEEADNLARRAEVDVTCREDDQGQEHEASSAQSSPFAMASSKTKKKKSKKRKAPAENIPPGNAQHWKSRAEQNTNLKRQNSGLLEPKLQVVPKTVKEAAPTTVAGKEVNDSNERHNPEDYKGEGEEFTYRRLARDEDSVPNLSIELDY